MTAEPAESAVWERYAARLALLEQVDGPPAPVADELAGPTGGTPPFELAETVRGAIDALGAGGLLTRRAAVRRHVRDDGLTYGTTAAGGGRWNLDPLPVVISAQEWSGLREGLAQRARLMDAILTDLYGARRLLAEGVVPPAVVLGHDGFLQVVDGIRTAGPRQLVLTAVDLARAADGTWTVLNDRDQAPSGAGYAMADRRIVARTMPRLYREAPLARLRGFFGLVRDALDAAAPPGTDAPNVVLLSPGPDSETAFDQAFVASLTGLPLVQAEDLSMRDGKVWRRTTGRPEQVDVVLRRVDAAWSDPLDLRGDSRLGIPGLVEATRRGLVSVVNPLGTGVLENPGLLPYLDDACGMLLGEPMTLPVARTWWCGATGAERADLDRLAECVIKPISREASEPTRFGWTLSSGELADLRARIEAEPWRFVVQEPLPMSTTPVIGSHGLEPRRLVLRAFGVASGEDYRIMPGGLGRVSVDADSLVVSNALGGIAKDIWVAAPEPEVGGAIDLHPVQAHLPGIAGETLGLSPRVADDLFWLGRYAERAESTARLLMTVDDLVADHFGRAASPGQVAMHTLHQALLTITGIPATASDHPADDLRRVLTDESLEGSVAASVRQSVRAAHAVRELLSPDTWLVLARLDNAIAADEDDEPLSSTLRQVLESLVAFAGLCAENTVRDAVWSFLDLGRRVERAQQVTALLRATVLDERSPVAEGQIIEAVLRTLDSVITFRRRLGARHDTLTPFQLLLELVVRDPSNPRSVGFQAERVESDLADLGHPELVQVAAGLRQSVADADHDELSGEGRARLAEALAGWNTDWRELSDALTGVFFVRKAPQHGFSATAWEYGEVE
ncbi:circularly permuted type 2 ATP-grasp protein [Calidifontibacter sp. DB0510]|uniref:Circularly permuted type 2 ATP-grasp protein n=1 Tax=Metallococcus carri TaxID=1656884 RepID=A0A967EGB3_9MICO|nr:circularly permuted type 2 ATP-grasp protein [Metallococcus carri]NHN54858.1 circularly permuted type 2 ATP-grasp protein [Metallococcus carri]NOP37203.1 circularly permuted type 2 ATP-grasp protein [Calidifontibacter sp. DB2511S]